MTLNRLRAQANRILAGDSPEGGDAKGLARLVVEYAEELREEIRSMAQEGRRHENPA